MKKLIVLAVTLMVTFTVFSQTEPVIQLQNDYMAYIDSAGIQLRGSANAMATCMATGIAASGAAVWYANEQANDGDMKIVAASLTAALGATSIIAYIVHVAKIGKAGKQLRKANEIYLINKKQTFVIQQNKDGMGLAFKF